MAVLVISDTHGSFAAWEKVRKYLTSDIEYILHAGDIYYFGPRNPIPEGYAPGTLASELNSLNIPIICSKGNCDSEVDQMVSNFPLCSPFAFALIYEKKFLITHGDRYSREELLTLAKQWKIDIFITGHTHLAQLERISDVIFLNPGSCALPKNFPGAGIIRRKTIELLNLLDGSLIEKINLSE
ncbi:MAG: phosphodiesterase [bacterium]|nr:phosphodiesterase [bacterium]